MHDTPAQLDIASNRLLATLPPKESDFIRPHLELAAFPIGHFVALADDSLKRCFFPTKGMISLLAETEHGHAVEVGFTGVEGMIGTSIMLGKNVMPYQALVQAPTEGFIAETGRVLQLFAMRGVFHDIVLRYAYVELRQMAQTAVCNHFHPIQARMCRWLAVMCERSANTNLRVTQEFLAHMLGVQRTSVGSIAMGLQHAGVIAYRRGRVEILDLKRLQAAACECYGVIQKELADFAEVGKLPDMSSTQQTARV